MKERYLILPKKLNASRLSALVFAALTLLFIVAVQIIVTVNEKSTAVDLPFLYGPAILMILASAFRSYFFFLLANIYYTVRMTVQVIMASFREGAYTSYEIFDMLVLFILLCLSAALTWQVILFYTGHADNVALTHTSLICVIFCFIFIFFPYIIHLFLEDQPVTETWDALLLSLSFLSFSHGIEKLPREKEEPDTEA